LATGSATHRLRELAVASFLSCPEPLAAILSLQYAIFALSLAFVTTIVYAHLLRQSLDP